MWFKNLIKSNKRKTEQLKNTIQPFYNPPKNSNYDDFRKYNIFNPNTKKIIIPEKEILDTLDDRELMMLQGEFKMTDIAWKRANDTTLSIQESRSYNIFSIEESLNDFIIILNSNKDYKGASILASQIASLNISGFSALVNSTFYYHRPEYTRTTNHGFEYLFKQRKMKRLSDEKIKDYLEYGYRMCEGLIPFSYIKKEQFFLLFKNHCENQKNQNKYYYQDDEFIDNYIDIKYLNSNFPGNTKLLPLNKQSAKKYDRNIIIPEENIYG